MDWGVELRKFRADVGMKQDVAASHLGVSQAYVSRLESGTARPSEELAGRIRQLLETPRHRPHFEHWRATVLHSPHMLILSSLQGRDVRVEALSPAVAQAGPPFDAYKPGHLVSEELGEAAVEEIERLIRLGAFSGDVSCVDGYWYSPGRGGAPRYWRTVNVPVRDQIGNWYLHSTSLEVDEAEYAGRLQRHGDGLIVHLFNRRRPIAARELLEDQPPAAQRTA